MMSPLRLDVMPAFVKPTRNDTEIGIEIPLGKTKYAFIINTFKKKENPTK